MELLSYFIDNYNAAPVKVEMTSTYNKGVREESRRSAFKAGESVKTTGCRKHGLRR